jgi:hypothetical protein
VPLLAWSGFLVCFSILRFALLALRPRKNILTDEEAARLRLRAAVVSTVGGVAWGLGEIFIILASDSFVHQVFMAFVIGGMSAGAMAGLTFCLPAFYGFCAPALMMTAAAYFVLGEQTYLVMGGMVLLFGLTRCDSDLRTPSYFIVWRWHARQLTHS